MKKLINIFGKLCGFSFIAFGLTACTNYGAPGTFGGDLVRDASDGLALSPGGIEQGGFLAPRPALIALSPAQEQNLPIPGSERRLPLKANTAKNKKEKPDAYALYRQFYSQAYAKDDDISLELKTYPMDAIIKPSQIPDSLAKPPADFFKPAPSAPAGDKGLDESVKRSLREKDPNLTPSKKPWW